MRNSSVRTLAAVCTAMFMGLAGFAAGHARGQHGAEVEAIVTQLKQDLVRAYIEASVEELDRIYTDDYTVADARGQTRTKASEISRLEADGTTLTSGTYEPVKIRVFGDVAVMSGHGDLRGAGPDGDYHHRYYSFNVFVYRDARWQYAAAFLP